MITGCGCFGDVLTEGDKMKKIKWLLLLVFAMVLTACSSEEVIEDEVPELADNQIYAFFVNVSKTDVYPVPYALEGKATSDVVRNIIQYLMYEEGTADYQTPIPAGMTYSDTVYDDAQNSARVSFNVRYESVSSEDLLFFKTCVAWTVLQLDKVDTISISLTDLSNQDVETATTVETFDRDSFTFNFGDRSGYKQTGTIVLYFADETGEVLKEYTHTVEISNTTSLARLVVESLIAGPDEEGYTATLSDEIKINNISVNNGICYVDLSEEFYDTANPLRNEIIVYSVVNSLVELPTVSKVQFLKNGEKLQFFRETMPFDGIFERNLNLIVQEEDK